MNFVAKFITQKRRDLNKDQAYLKTVCGKKTSKAMAERYGVDIKDPDALSKARAEVDAQLEVWKTPYTNTELMNQVREAWQTTNPIGLENGQSDFSVTRLGNKGSVKFLDGVARKPKALVLDSLGNKSWAVFKSIPELQEKGFHDGDVHMRVGNDRFGLLHIIKHRASDPFPLEEIDKVEQLVKTIVESAFEFWQRPDKSDRAIVSRGNSGEERDGKSLLAS